MHLSEVIQKGKECGIDFNAFETFKSAKTPSFFALGGFVGISKEMVEALVKLGDFCQESVRYCLHNNPSDSLHLMLIYHPYKKEIPEQIFQHTDSYYILQSGEFSLTNLETKECFVVGDKHCGIVKIAKGERYQMEILSSSVLFIEVRERNER